MNETFLDASYAIALSVKSDDFHEQALLFANQLESERTRLVTTRAVLLEIGNGLSKQRYRQAASELLAAIQADPDVEVVPVSTDIYDRALQLYIERPDKQWGLTDCASFIVMQDRGITEALTTDDHFRQAGFRVLLRD